MEKAFDEMHIVPSFKHSCERTHLGQGDTRCRFQEPSGSPVRIYRMPWNTRAREPIDSSFNRYGDKRLSLLVITPCQLPMQSLPLWPPATLQSRRTGALWMRRYIPLLRCTPVDSVCYWDVGHDRRGRARPGRDLSQVGVSPADSHRVR